MVKLRLTRTGTRNAACYRVVAIDERRGRDGRPLEYLGSFDPKPDPQFVVLDRERIDTWLARGARPSPAVRALLRRARRRAAEQPAPPATAGGKQGSGAAAGGTTGAAEGG